MRIFIILLLSECLLGQSRPAVVDTNIANVANLPAQEIAANDLVAVAVYDSPELTRTIRVAADGTIRLPMLKKRISADGLLPGQLESAVAEALRSEEILVDPVVTVTILEYDSRPVNVVGAVKKPVTFQAAGKIRLLEALAKAEGLTAEAGPEILLTRPEPGPDGTQTALVQRIPVRLLIDAADASLNVELKGGEEIRVPEARKIYVVGNVRRPGAFPMRDGSETTVLKILAYAEGLAPFAAKTAYIYRGGGSVEKQEIAIELEKIMQRKAADVPLAADDVLYVPDNKGRRQAMTVIDRLSGFGASTASGVLIWRR